ncbi:MAG TPA: hypothetical protein VNC84_06030 [Gammaproteobacteria bacterium]|jgi:hypothetical protein|nr:hypothetical protein [Gammaproteobacteria bacterium]
MAAARRDFDFDRWLSKLHEIIGKDRVTPRDLVDVLSEPGAFEQLSHDDLKELRNWLPADDHAALFNQVFADSDRARQLIQRNNKLLIELFRLDVDESDHYVYMPEGVESLGGNPKSYRKIELSSNRKLLFPSEFLDPACTQDAETIFRIFCMQILKEFTSEDDILSEADLESVAKKRFLAFLSAKEISIYIKNIRSFIEVNALLNDQEAVLLEQVIPVLLERALLEIEENTLNEASLFRDAELLDTLNRFAKYQDAIMTFVLSHPTIFYHAFENPRVLAKFFVGYPDLQEKVVRYLLLHVDIFQRILNNDDCGLSAVIELISIVSSDLKEEISDFLLSHQEMREGFLKSFDMHAMRCFDRLPDKLKKEIFDYWVSDIENLKSVFGRLNYAGLNSLIHQLPDDLKERLVDLLCDTKLLSYFYEKLSRMKGLIHGLPGHLAVKMTYFILHKYHKIFGRHIHCTKFIEEIYEYRLSSHNLKKFIPVILSYPALFVKYFLHNESEWMTLKWYFGSYLQNGADVLYADIVRQCLLASPEEALEIITRAQKKRVDVANVIVTLGRSLPCLPTTVLHEVSSFMAESCFNEHDCQALEKRMQFAGPETALEDLHWVRYLPNDHKKRFVDHLDASNLKVFCKTSDDLKLFITQLPDDLKIRFFDNVLLDIELLDHYFTSVHELMDFASDLPDYIAMRMIHFILHNDLRASSLFGIPIFLPRALYQRPTIKKNLVQSLFSDPLLFLKNIAGPCADWKELQKYARSSLDIIPAPYAEMIKQCLDLSVEEAMAEIKRVHGKRLPIAASIVTLCHRHAAVAVSDKEPGEGKLLPGLLPCLTDETRSEVAAFIAAPYFGRGDYLALECEMRRPPTTLPATAVPFHGGIFCKKRACETEECAKPSYGL